MHRRRPARARRLALTLALVAAFALNAGPAAAWSPAGHMVVGAMTYRILQRTDPEALQVVLSVLSRHPHWGKLLDAPEDRARDEEDRGIAAFMRAARWADDVRSAPYDEYSEPTWHYVNFRYRPPDELTPPRGPEQDGYLLWALPENMRRLDSESPPVRAIAITWLFHLVGDVHQPLHDLALIDGARPNGDRGGNDTFVRASATARTVTLHWIWDGMITGSDEFRAARNRATELLADPAYSADALAADAANLDFFSWAEQGAHLAIDHAQLRGAIAAGTREEGTILPDGYFAQARPVAERQAVLAAYRLAHLLSAAF